jgi:MoaA/NifB/PqqE/SkfB family radical SAM enzyme
MTRLMSLVSWLLDSKTGEKIFRRSVGLLYRDAIRRPLLKAVWYITDVFVRAGRHHGKAPRIDRERVLFAQSVLTAVDRIAERRTISRDFMEHASLLWARALVNDEQDPARVRFTEEHGVGPPWVLVIAPTGACNLRCPGCYSGQSTGGGMPFHELDRIVTEAKKLWGIKVVVFTGGEPFLYRSESKGILDIAERHDDLLCLIFSNGSLIDRDIARRLVTIGTPTVALSVEGLREPTDARRGPGAFDRTLRAMSDLREAGALVGISMTATRDNYRDVFADELLDFFFVENSVVYGFVFQYMPEGSDPDPSLMPTPEQRLWMWKRSWEVLEKRRIPLFDFWNHGTLIGGCIAAGRERGYMYVDWDGNVLPCVFAPYSDRNIHEIHAAGGTLNDAWASPFQSEIRAWQKGRATAEDAVACATAGGRMVCTCPVRDHYGDFREMVLKTGALPAGPSAGSCISNTGFVRQMTQYGQDFVRVSKEVLDSEYT